jgi:hypothetical protein
MRIDNGGRGFKHGSGPLNTRNDTKNFEAEIIKPFRLFRVFRGHKRTENRGTDDVARESRRYTPMALPPLNR